MNDIRNTWWVTWCLIVIAIPASITVVFFALRMPDMVIAFFWYYSVPWVILGFLLGAVFKLCPRDSTLLEKPVDKKVKWLIIWFFGCWLLQGLVEWVATQTIFSGLASIIPYIWLASHLSGSEETTATDTEPQADAHSALNQQNEQEANDNHERH